MTSPTFDHPLARSLAAAGVLPADTLQLALEQAKQEQKPLSLILVEQQWLSSRALARFCEQTFDQPLTNLEEFPFEQLPSAFMNMRLIERHHAMPLKQQDKVLYLAMSDPTNIAALEAFGFHFGLMTEVLLVEENQLQQRMFQLQQGNIERHHYSAEADGPAAELNEPAPVLNDNIQFSEDDAPVIRYINNIIMDAVRKGASDLHFEPYEHFFRVRFRVDGLLYEMASPPIKMAARLTARLKVMAQLDIAERRLPQDGKSKLTLTTSQSVDMRMSTLPTRWGEKVVIRLLDNSTARLDIDQLGLTAKQKTLYLEALQRPQGLILITGPTGSGKTVSLYTGLNILNSNTANISTAEDPIEINLPGINQVQINPKAGLSFANALRAFLRQDPDIIMVGEIRDAETAEMAAKAAQTGHLVLSTLHTNSAAETLVRLGNMGLPAYSLASSITLIIAQRLVRKLCMHCRVPESLSATQLRRAGFTQEQLTNGVTLYRAAGCDQCTDGYKGRTGIYELMTMNERLAELIMSNAGALALARAAEQEGMMSLRLSALTKAAKGIISLAEVNRLAD